MAVILVARHQGAIEWMAQQGLKVDKHELHFDAQHIKPGDQVVGILPIHLIAKVCQQGGRYWHLQVEVPFELRGKELSMDDLNSLNAKLVEYKVEEIAAN